MPTAPLDDQLCFALYSASMAVSRACKPALDRLGITYPQYLVLLALWDEDARTVGAIAGRLGLDSSTVTPLVKRLERNGLVERARNPQDERWVVVSLTDRGRSLRTDCAIVGETLFARAGMGAERIVALKRDAQALRDALGDEAGDAGAKQASDGI